MTSISERGQIVIPKYFREALGWTAESEVRFQVDDNRLIVERKESIGEELRRLAKEQRLELTDKVDFDDEYDEGIRKKYRKMGLL